MLLIMNDVERRRIKLLQETRKNYSDKHSPPAIHPRFQCTYDSLYRDKKNGKPNKQGTLLVRTIIAILLFALFFFMDYHNEKIGMIDSQVVIREVQRDLFGK